MAIVILLLTCIVFLNSNRGTCGVDAKFHANDHLNIHAKAHVSSHTDSSSDLQINDNVNLNVDSQASGFINNPPNRYGQDDANGNASGRGNRQRNAKNNAQLQVEQFDMKAGHRVFVQLAGDTGFAGCLEPMGWRPIPAWILHPREPTIPNDIPERVYVRSPNAEGLYGGLTLLHNNSNPYVETDRCFVVLGNNVVLTAILKKSNIRVGCYNNTRVYVRVPTPNNTVFTGILRLEHHALPIWVH